MLSLRRRANQLALGAAIVVVASAIALHVGHPIYEHNSYDPAPTSGSDNYSQAIFVTAFLALTIIVAVWSHWTFRRRDPSDDQ